MYSDHAPICDSYKSQLVHVRSMITPTFVNLATSLLCSCLFMFICMTEWGGNHVFQLLKRTGACTYFLYRTHKKVHIEIRKVVSFLHSQVKFMRLQELLIKNTRSITRNSNKICEHLRVIENEYQVWIELYRNLSISDLILKNRPNCHSWYFEKYQYEVLNPPLFSRTRL